MKGVARTPERATHETNRHRWKSPQMGLGYHDFAFWAKLDALGCRLVTHFKTNTPLNAPREMPLPAGSTVLSDRIGDLTGATGDEPQQSDAGWGARDPGQEQEIAKETHGFLELVRLVRANLMHRKDAARLRKPPSPPPLDSNQLQLCLSPT